MMFLMEKGFPYDELAEMPCSEFRDWYDKAVRRHNREIKRQNDANNAT